MNKKDFDKMYDTILNWYITPGITMMHPLTYNIVKEWWVNEISELTINVLLEINNENN